MLSGTSSKDSATLPSSLSPAPRVPIWGTAGCPGLPRPTGGSWYLAAVMVSSTSGPALAAERRVHWTACERADT